MNILHTSDWHIGRVLYGRKRYEEFDAFLHWLVETIHQHHVDVLIVAGDIFDTMVPSNRAQELYYDFLCRVAKSSCRHVIMVAGNHDSPSFLSAPKALLSVLNVHVIGRIAHNPADDVLVLCNPQTIPELIVCAVPYLRDRDIRIAEMGESIEDKERKMIEGIRNHYALVAAIAWQKRCELAIDIPIVATGHLFTAGGKTCDGDGVRDLYVGSLAHVTANIFPACFNYVALGHLHVPQTVNNSETIRYSGSPLAMGFGEARQQKSVCLVDVTSTTALVTQIDIPVFQALERIKGDWDTISNRLLELIATGLSVWIEIIYEGEELIGDLPKRLAAVTLGTSVEILRVKNNRVMDRVLRQGHQDDTLDNLDVNAVFERCLAAHKIPDTERQELMIMYQETLSSLYNEDVLAD